MNKSILFDLIIANTKNDLEQLEFAANQAKMAATHEQSKAETQYDTLGLENAFLASGQSKRAHELGVELNQFIAMAENDKCSTNGQSDCKSDEVRLGSLVRYEVLPEKSTDKSFVNEVHWVLVANSLGGTLVNIAADTLNVRSNNPTIKINIVTTNTPIGRKLFNRAVDDEVDLMLGNSRKTIHILSVY